jgi:hypothetical protein
MPPEPQNTPKLSPPVFIWILIIVAALIGSIQIWEALLQKVSVQNQPLKSSDWKIYKNESRHFQISYPATMKAREIYAHNIVVCFEDEEQTLINGLAVCIDDNTFPSAVSTSNSIIINDSDFKQTSGKYSGGSYVIYSENVQLLKNIVSTFKFISTSTNSRILLTPDNVRKYNDEALDNRGDVAGCGYQFDYSTSTEDIRYSNVTKGLSFDLPFNPKWGGLRFRLNPYDETDNGINFGYMFAFEGCGWVREYNLNLLPVKSIKNILEEIKADNFVGYPDPIQKKIGDVLVVEYTEGEFCSEAEIIILGVKYNYKLAALCSEDFVRLEEIVKSMKLIN